MATLPTSTNPEFEALLSVFLGVDNAARGQAESVFMETKKAQPDQLLANLILVLRHSARIELRAMAAVLLRRINSKAVDPIWVSLSPASHALFKEQLLLAASEETDPTIRSKIGDTLGELGAWIMMSDAGWPELVPFLFTLVSSDNEAHVEVALKVFSLLVLTIADSLEPQFTALGSVFQHCLADPGLGWRVRVEAIKALGYFLFSISQPSKRDMFRPLVAPMLSTLSELLSLDRQYEAVDALEVFIGIADTNPSFFHHAISDVFTAMLTVLTTAALDDNTRQMALEVLVALSETAGGMCRQLPGNAYVEGVLPALLSLLMEVSEEDEEEWEAEGDDGLDPMANTCVAEQALERLARAMGQKRVLPALQRLISPLLTHAEWAQRHTALMALAQMADILDDEDHLATVTNLAVSMAGDPHPRVRYAVMNLLGRLPIDQAPIFQMCHHATVMPVLVAGLNDAQSVQVQAHAAAALVNYCDTCTEEYVTPYAEGILGSLYTRLASSPRVVQEQVVTAVASVAHCCLSEFEPFYDSFMPPLRAILAQCTAKEDRLFRAKALECVSFIGLSVRQEKFVPDATAVMQELLAQQAAPMEADDPHRTYLIQALARFCKALGRGFTPYLPLVMPPLLACVAEPVGEEVKANETAMDSDDEDSDDEGVITATVGTKVLRVRTSQVEEKALAIQMLSCFVRDLKADFAPYVEQCAQLMLPLLRAENSIHDDIRSSAAAALPPLLLAAKLSTSGQAAGEAYVSQMLNTALPELLRAVSVEEDRDTLNVLLQSVQRTVLAASTVPGTEEGVLSPDGRRVDVQYTPVLGEAAMQAISAACLKEMDASIQRRAVFAAEMSTMAAEGMLDEEGMMQAEMMKQQGEEVRYNISEIVGSLLRTHREHFLPVLQAQLLPTIARMGHPACLASDRKLAVFVIDDMLEHTGTCAAAVPLIAELMPVVVAAAVAEDNAVRQAALFGLGAAADKLPAEVLAPLVPDIVARLSTVISAADAFTPVNAPASDNAVSALGKLCEAQLQRGAVTGLDTQALLSLWLQHQPLVGDKEESRAVTRRLCCYLEEGGAMSAALLQGESCAGLGPVVRVLAEVLGTKRCTDEALTARIVAILQQMQGSVPQPLLAAAWATLTEDHRAAIQQQMEAVAAAAAAAGAVGSPTKA